MLKADTRKTHPNLYFGITAFGLISVALGLNMIFTTTTYYPYSINDVLTGTILIAIGVFKIATLNLQLLTLVRWSMAASVGFMLFYGLGYAIGFLSNDIPTMQPFILYSGLAVLQIPALIEPSANPLNLKSSK